MTLNWNYQVTICCVLIICLSETDLNSETPPYDTQLELSSYNLLLSDYPANNKRGVVCIYHKSNIVSIYHKSNIVCTYYKSNIVCIYYK